METSRNNDIEIHDDRHPLVSVIIPVYNTEKYLRQCVASVLAQTYSYVEVILINDGSSDASGKICDELSAGCDKIRTIHTPNRGPASARNAGLDIMKGQYVAFIDSDDAIHPLYLEYLMNISRHNECDLACITQTRRSERNLYLNNIEKYGVEVMASRQAVMSMLYQKGLPDCSVCGKLYPSRFFENERFSNGILYEDMDISYRIMLQARKVAISSAPLYYYRVNTSSILHTFTPGRADVLQVTHRMEEFFTSCHKDEKLRKAARQRRFSAAFNIFGLTVANGGDPKVADRCWDMILELRGATISDPHSRIKNKIGALASYLGGRRLISQLAKKIYSL